MALWIAEFRSPPPLLPKSSSSLEMTASTTGLFRKRARQENMARLSSAQIVHGIVMLRNCFEGELEYDDFVEHHVLRLHGNEPRISFISSSVLSGIWRPREYQPDEDESESGDRLENRTKNTIDAERLTVDEALRIFTCLRSLGLRRK